MIPALVIAIVLAAFIESRVLKSSSLTPDLLRVSWSISGQNPFTPTNLTAALQGSLRNAASSLMTDSFHIGTFARSSINGLQLPNVDDHEALLRLTKGILECALEDQQAAYIRTSNGKRLKIEGLVGMAPHWVRHGIDKDAQEAVSACLAARATIFDTMSISLRGSALAVYADSEEEKLYPILQGNFWGNMFDQEDAQLMSCSSVEMFDIWNHSRVRATGAPVGNGHLRSGIMRYAGSCNRICYGGPESDEPLSIRVCNGNIHVVAVYTRKHLKP